MVDLGQKKVELSAFFYALKSRVIKPLYTQQKKTTPYIRDGF